MTELDLLEDTTHGLYGRTSYIAYILNARLLILTTSNISAGLEPFTVSENTSTQDLKAEDIASGIMALHRATYMTVSCSKIFEDVRLASLIATLTHGGQIDYRSSSIRFVIASSTGQQEYSLTIKPSGLETPKVHSMDPKSAHDLRSKVSGLQSSFIPQATPQCLCRYVYMA